MRLCDFVWHFPRCGPRPEEMGDQTHSTDLDEALVAAMYVAGTSNIVERAYCILNGIVMTEK